jgi:hypothetical protein
MSVSLILLVSLLLQCLLVLLLLLVGAINDSVRTADEDASVVLVLLVPRCFEDADQEEAEVVLGLVLLALVVLVMYAGRGYDPSPSFGIIIGVVATGSVVAVGPWTGVLVLEKDVPKLVLLLSSVTSTAFSSFDSCSSPLDLNRFLPNGSSCLCS